MVLNNQRKAVGQLREILNSVSPSYLQQFDYLKGLPFYHWPDVTNDSQSPVTGLYQQSATDFNHAIGLPRKNDMACVLHDYEQLLYDTLQSNKHIWIKKATGLGITEFMLRYMAWLCFQDATDPQVRISGSQMCIVTGPRIELSITLIDRMKGLFNAQISALTGSTVRGQSF